MAGAPYIYCQETPDWDETENEEQEAETEKQHQVIPVD